MLLVLLIVSITSISFVSYHSSSNLSVFTKKMQLYANITQEKAYAQRQRKDVYIETNQAIFDEEVFVYPQGIACTPFTYHYNANGNISMANSVTCTKENQKQELVFQLGTGRVYVR